MIFALLLSIILSFLIGVLIGRFLIKTDGLFIRDLSDKNVQRWIIDVHTIDIESIPKKKYIRLKVCDLDKEVV